VAELQLVGPRISAHAVKIYNTKREIFQDYQIAVKFRLKYDVSRDAYERFFSALRANDNWKIAEFNSEVHHLNTHYPISVGLFAEVPVTNQDGKEVGGRFVILEHESGPEFFLPADPHVVLVAATAVATWAGRKVIEKLKDSAMEKITKAITCAIRDHWPTQAFRVETPIRYVEIRTETKGVMRIRYEDFTPTQLTCLVRHFPKLAHISDCNATCFGNSLFDADNNIDDNGI
jgi:hypothetical protein